MDLGAGSFHHQAKKEKNPDFYCFVTSLWLFIFEELCKCISVPNPHPNLEDLYVFGPPGSASRSVSQRYGSEDPDPHPDPYQNITDPQHCSLACPSLIKKIIKFSSNIRKFRMEQLQSHIWLTASSYMGKYLSISSYIRKPFLTIWLCNCSTLNFLIYIWGKFDLVFLSVL